MRSDEITKGLQRTPHRSLLYGTGVSEQQINKRFIGIARYCNHIAIDFNIAFFCKTSTHRFNH